MRALSRSRVAAMIMTDEGAGGLTIAETARRLGVRPPSIYKYFPSLLSIYDELFRRGQANEPGTPWGTGRFTPLLSPLIGLLRCAYPPATAQPND
jgi:AcrR family transcriptional regulator